MKKLLIALAVGVAVFAAAYASAATLGGLNSDDLGSDDDVVASCDSDGVVVTYDTVYSAASAAYIVDKINVTGVDAACAGQTIKATLSGGATIPSDASLTEVTQPAVAGSNVLDVTATVIAEQVQGVHVLISGS